MENPAASTVYSGTSCTAGIGCAASPRNEPALRICEISCSIWSTCVARYIVIVPSPVYYYVRTKIPLFPQTYGMTTLKIRLAAFDEIASSSYADYCWTKRRIRGTLESLPFSGGRGDGWRCATQASTRHTQQAADSPKRLAMIGICKQKAPAPPIGSDGGHCSLYYFQMRMRQRCAREFSTLANANETQRSSATLSGMSGRQRGKGASRWRR